MFYFLGTETKNSDNEEVRNLSQWLCRFNKMWKVIQTVQCSSHDTYQHCDNIESRILS